MALDRFSILLANIPSEYIITIDCAYLLQIRYKNSVSPG